MARHLGHLEAIMAAGKHVDFRHMGLGLVLMGALTLCPAQAMAFAHNGMAVQGFAQDQASDLDSEDLIYDVAESEDAYPSSPENEYFESGNPFEDEMEGADLTAQESQIEEQKSIEEEEQVEAYAAVNPDCASHWYRLGGKNALGTMKEIVGIGFSSTSTVIVATNKSYKDALSASALAGYEYAPILLTGSNILSKETKDEINRLQPSKVYIVGGPLAVSAAVEKQIKALPGISSVERIAGKNAPDTARKVAAKLPMNNYVIVATSKDFADALSIAPWAYANHAAIILLEGNKTLSSASLSSIKKLGSTRALIVGGTSAVPSSVENALKDAGLTITRLGGKNAIDTSRLIAEWELSNGFTIRYAGIATRSGFKDALTGAALMGRLKGPVLLATDKNRSAIEALLKDKCQTLKRGYVFGGEGAVSKETWNYTLKTICKCEEEAINNAYTVKYNANGGTGSMQDQSIKVGSLDYLRNNEFSKAGYAFIGWSTKADGSGMSYDDRERVINIAAGGRTITLYAQWQARKYTIQYHPNYYRNAYFPYGSGSMDSQQATYNTSVKLAKNNFTMSGYTFSGWNTKPDGTGVTYKDQQSVKNLAESGTVTLYAQWHGGDEPQIGFRVSSWSNTSTIKKTTQNSRQADGSNTYTLTIDTDRTVADIEKNLTIRYSDVTPPAYKRTFKDMGVNMAAPRTVSQEVSYSAGNYYPVNVVRPFSVGYENISGKFALSTLKLTVQAGMGVRAIKAEAVYKGEVVDTYYIFTSGRTPNGDYSEADTKLYDDVRHKVEAKLWTSGMTNAEKLMAIANYINSTTHYPNTNATSLTANPEYWADWSVDGIGLYYSMANDTRINRVMRFQGGITTCQAADTIVTVATDDLGLPYLYDGDTDTVGEGEGVWRATGSYSSNPGNPWHETAIYQYPDGTRAYIDAQGVMTSCSSHDCKTELISLK